MCVRVKEMMPKEIETSWEIAYVLFGRRGFYIFFGLFLVFGWVICLASFIVLGDLGESLFEPLWLPDEPYEEEDLEQWRVVLLKRWPYVMVSAILRLATIFDKDRESMYVSAYFIRALLFLGFSYANYFSGKTYLSQDEIEEIDWDVAKVVKVDRFLITAIAVVILAWTS